MKLLAGHSLRLPARRFVLFDLLGRVPLDKNWLDMFNQSLSFPVADLDYIQPKDSKPNSSTSTGVTT